MTFEEVLPYLKDGRSIRRAGWIYEWCLAEDAVLEMSNDWLGNIIVATDGPGFTNMQIATIRHDDILADDWEVAE